MKPHPLFSKLRIFAPGPTPVPESVLSDLMKAPLHHRTKEFIGLLERVRENLKFLFQTKESVYVLTSSGTGAMEAALVNLFSAQDEVLVVNGGKFGERWEKMALKYGLKATVLKIEWGQSIDPEVIQKTLASNRSIKGVLVQANETSTGVYHDIEKISKVVREFSKVLLIVDAITALGVTPLPMDEWGIDAVVSGSQKALMLPPGLSFLALSEKSKTFRKNAGLPKFYFNLDAEDKSLMNGETAWTPNVSLVMALDRILLRFKEIGHEAVFAYHALLAEATRRGMRGMGLELFAKENPSNALTAVRVPTSIPDGKKIVSHLRDKFGITIAGGQDEFKGKIFRVAHLGHYDVADVLLILSVLEITLKSLGHSLSLGSGISSAEAYFLEHPL